MKARTPGWASRSTQKHCIYPCVWRFRVVDQCEGVRVWHTTGLHTQKVVLRHPFHYLHIFWDIVRNLPSISPDYLRTGMLFIHRITSCVLVRCHARYLLRNLSEGIQKDGSYLFGHIWYCTAQCEHDETIISRHPLRQVLHTHTNRRPELW